MTTVGVVGLGLIGGSLCKALKSRTGFTVLGADSSPATSCAAMKEGAIDGLLEGRFGECDALLLAIYPQDAIDALAQCVGFLPKNALVVDMVGVKERICSILSPFCAERGLRFVGGHPMAGTERSGFEFSLGELFDGATMLLCRDEHTDESALRDATALFLSLGFGQVKVTSPGGHDKIIAYTSQLAHVVSSAYIKSPTLDDRLGFTAGSYKDMTRVARLNPDMWTKLFLENRDNLVFEIDQMTSHLEQYREALASGDEQTLFRLLQEGSQRKIADEEGEEHADSADN